MAESKSAALPLGYAPIGRAICAGGRTIPTRARRINFCRDRRRACGRRAFEAITAPRASRSVAQPGSAPRSGRGGRRFKSCHSDHYLARYRGPTPTVFPEAMVSWVFMAKPVVATSAEIDAGMQVIIDSVPGIEPTKAREMAHAVLKAAGRVR